MPSVLVIDDDPCIRAVITSTFRRMGYEVRSAENGLMGTVLFEITPADLVITDIFMPEMDGIETIAALRRHAPVPAIIAISGGGAMCGTETLSAAKLLGADAVMSKPLSMSALLHVAGELLGAQAEGPARRAARGVNTRRHAA